MGSRWNDSEMWMQRTWTAEEGVDTDYKAETDALYKIAI